MAVPALVGRRMHPHILGDSEEWGSCKWGWCTGSDELCQSMVPLLSWEDYAGGSWSHPAVRPLGMPPRLYEFSWFESSPHQGSYGGVRDLLASK